MSCSTADADGLLEVYVSHTGEDFYGAVRSFGVVPPG